MRIVILWPGTERVGTQSDLDPRVPGLRARCVDQLRELGCEVVVADTEADAITALPEADVFYGGGFPRTLLDAAKNLRWMQSSVAGMDNFWYPELRQAAFTLTNARGIYSDVIADHVHAFILSFARGMHIFARRQSLGEWNSRVAPVTHLEGATLGIIGLGGIGLAVAERGHVAGMRIVAVDPAPKGTPDFVARVWPPDGLHDMLAESDFVAVCVPHTGETEHMIDAAALDAMKDSAVIINIGRGKVIELDALTAALLAGTIGGAGLDVLEQEPLPADHPLWQMENVIITPHSAGRSSIPYQEQRRMDLFVENTRRFLAGNPLLNVVDKQRGYVV